MSTAYALGHILIYLEKFQEENSLDQNFETYVEI